MRQPSAWCRRRRVRKHLLQTSNKDTSMKIKTNVRAGKSINNTVVSYVSTTSRCVGL